MKELEKNELMAIDGGLTLYLDAMFTMEIAVFWAGFSAGWKENKR